MKTTGCVNSTKLDEQLCTSRVFQDKEGNPLYSAFSVAQLRALYESSDIKDKFKVDETSKESIRAFAQELGKFKNRLIAQSTSKIQDACTNSATAYSNLLKAVKGKEYKSANHEYTKFSPSAIIKQRGAAIAHMFSQKAEQIRATIGSHISKLDIIQGFKNSYGKPQYGEDYLFKCVYQDILQDYLTTTDSGRKAELEIILTNWGAFCMIARVQLRRTEGLKLGAFNDYALRVELNEMEEIMDGADILDIEESKKEAWMEKKDRTSGFHSLGTEVRAVISSIPKIAHINGEVVEVVDDLGFPVMVEPMYVHDILITAFRGMQSANRMMDILAMEASNEAPHVGETELEALGRARAVEAVLREVKDNPTLKTKMFTNYKKGFTAYSQISISYGKNGVSFKSKFLNSAFSTGASEWGTALVVGTSSAEVVNRFANSIFTSDPLGNLVVSELEYKLLDRNGNEVKIEGARGLITHRINSIAESLSVKQEGDTPFEYNTYVKDYKDHPWSEGVKKLTSAIIKDVNGASKKMTESQAKWEKRKNEAITKKNIAYDHIKSIASLFGIPVSSGTLDALQATGKLDKFVSNLLYLCNPYLTSENGILSPKHKTDGSNTPIAFRDLYFNKDAEDSQEFREKIASVYQYLDAAQNLEASRRARVLDSKGKQTTVYSDQLPCFFTDTVETLMDFHKTGDTRGRDEYLVKKYFSDSMFYDGPVEIDSTTGDYKIDPKKIKNQWLRELYENPEFGKRLSHSRLAQMEIGGKMLSFENISSKHHALALLQQFNYSGSEAADANFAQYQLFVLGDSGVARFVKAPRYTTQEAISHLMTVVDQAIILRKQLIAVDGDLKKRGFKDGFAPAQKFDYKTLAFLTDPETGKQLSPTEIDILLKENSRAKIEKAIVAGLKRQKNNFKKQLTDWGILQKDEKNTTYSQLGEVRNEKGKMVKVTDENLDEYLLNYTANYNFAMQQQMQLMTVSPDYYKSIEELQKRYKEVHASGSPLDIHAEYLDKNGNKVKVFERVNPKTGKQEFYPAERTVYFDDMLINSEVNNPDFIKVINKHAPGSYGKYLKNTLTDGQSYRSIDSYRKIAIAQGLWNLNGKEEQAYQMILQIRNNPNLTEKQRNQYRRKISELGVVFQPQKPYLYTFENYTYTRTGTDGNTITEVTKIPVQHKCAEVVLIPELLPEHSALKHMADAMRENQIDVVCSTEVVKVGQFGATDIGYVTNEEGLYVNALGEVLPGKEGGDQPLNRADQRKHPNFNKVQEGIDNPSKYQPVNLISHYTSQGKTAKDAFSAAFQKAYVHELDLSTYYRQQNVPEHIHDSRNVGTQLRKIFFADLIMAGNNYETYLRKSADEDGKLVTTKEVNIGGKMYNISNEKGNGGRNLARFYNSLIVANLMRAYDSLIKDIQDDQKLSQALQQLVINSSESTYFSLMNYALTGDSQFLNPLYESCIEHDTSAKLISLFKKKVQQQKMLGGSAVQASAFGIDEVVKDSHTPNDGGLKFVCDYQRDDNGEFVLDKNGEKIPTNVLYAECEIPFDFSYTDALGNQVQLDYDKYCYTREDEQNGIGKEGDIRMDEDGKTALIEKDFPGILNMIAYRIPTERAYSMMNLKVKRFSKKSSGGIIKVPAEGTTIAGFDFDIDKLYFLRKEFKARKTTREENAEIWTQLYDENPQIAAELKNAAELKPAQKKREVYEHVSSLIDSIFGADVEAETRQQHYENLYEYWNKAGLTKLLGITASQFFSRHARTKVPLRFDEYDYKKDASENSSTQCNNEILNLLWHRLQDPETLPARVTPGGFPNASLAAKKERILSNPEYASQVLTNGVVDMDKVNALASDENKDYKTTYDVTDPSTLIYYNQQNQIAGTLIGVFANQNSNHTFASMAKECVLSEPISFCGHSYKDLINAPKGTNPSLTLAEFLASSVDAVKDPVLNYLNLNKITANAGALLGRLGYSSEEIGLLFNQPIIKELCEKIASDVYLSSNRDIDTAIKELIKKYPGLDLDSDSDLDLSSKLLASNIANYAVSSDQSTWIANNLESQKKALQIFKQAASYAGELANFVNTTKFSAAGSFGSTWGNLYHMQQVTEKYIRDAEKKVKSKTPHLQIIAWEDKFGQHLGIESNDLTSMSRLEYMDHVMSNPFAFEQCEYDMLAGFMKALCIDSDIATKKYPYETPIYKGIRIAMTAMTRAQILSEDTINSIHDDILVWLLSSRAESSFDGQKIVSPEEDKKMTQRQYYQEYYPEIFEAILYKEGADYVSPKTAEALKNWLYIDHNIKTGHRSIQPQRLNAVEKSSKEDFTILWESLATSDDYRDQIVARDLFMYCFYNYGFDFTSSNFIHNSSVKVKELVYIPTVLSTSSNEFEMMDYSTFLNDILNEDSVYLKALMGESGKYSPLINQFMRLYIRNHPDNYSFTYDIKRQEEQKSFEASVKKTDTGLVIDLTGKEKESWYNKVVLESSKEEGMKLIPAIIYDGKMYECATLNPNDHLYNMSSTQLSTVLYREVSILGTSTSKSYSNEMTMEELGQRNVSDTAYKAILEQQKELAKQNWTTLEVDHNRVHLGPDGKFYKKC